MTKIERKYNFKAGQKIASSQMNEELDQLVKTANDTNDRNDKHEQKQVDPTSADTTRDKHISNADLKSLYDEVGKKVAQNGNFNGTWFGLKPLDLQGGQQALDLQVIKDQLKQVEQNATNDVANINKKLDEAQTNFDKEAVKGGMRITVSSTAPTSPVANDIWIKL